MSQSKFLSELRENYAELSEFSSYPNKVFPSFTGLIGDLNKFSAK